MSFHGFNGNFQYNVEYEVKEEDYENVQKIFDKDVSYITPIVDLQHGENRAVLFSVDQAGKGCLSYSESGGKKLFRGPLDDVPRSREEFARSFKAWTIGDHKFVEEIERRNALWKHVHRLSNLGEDAADCVAEPEHSIVELVKEKEVGEEIELTFEYTERLIGLVADYYEIQREEVDDELLSDFIKVALKNGIEKSNV
jgi:hypothetical protein